MAPGYTPEARLVETPTWDGPNNAAVRISEVTSASVGK